MSKSSGTRMKRDATDERHLHDVQKLLVHITRGKPMHSTKDLLETTFCTLLSSSVKMREFGLDLCSHQVQSPHLS
jgi:hypothetical protein